MQKQVWLDARDIEHVPAKLRGFHAVLLGASAAPPDGVEAAVVVRDDGAGAVPAHAQIAVFPTLRAAAAHPAFRGRKALLQTVRTEADLERMAAELRSGMFDYGIVDLAHVTNIPLELLIAWFQRSPVQILKRTSTLTDGEIAATTLEQGCAGIVLAPASLADLDQAHRFLAQEEPEQIALVEWEVTRSTHVGVGHRACVDAVSMLTQTEGMLVGSTCAAMIMMCSETHELPYMPLRPFRVNAGGVHSYVLGPRNQTRYLGDLAAGHRSLAVDTSGRARPVIVGRVKIEWRPLRLIEFRSGGLAGTAFVQDDWHVRVMGAGGEVLNVTSCRAGTKLLGAHLPDARHCGLPIAEQLIER